MRPKYRLEVTLRRSGESIGIYQAREVNKVKIKLKNFFSSVWRVVKRIGSIIFQPSSIQWKIIMPISLAFLIMIIANFMFSTSALRESSDSSLSLLEQQQKEKQDFVNQSYSSIITAAFQNYELRVKNIVNSTQVITGLIENDQKSVQSYINSQARDDELIWITRVDKDVNGNGIIDEEEKLVKHDPYRQPPMPVYASTDADSIGHEPWYIASDPYNNPSSIRFIIEDTPHGSLLYTRYNITDREYDKLGEITFGVRLSSNFLKRFENITNTPTTLIMFERGREETKMYISADTGGDELADLLQPISYELTGEKYYLHDLEGEFEEVKQLLPHLEKFVGTQNEFTEIVDIDGVPYSILFKPVYGKKAIAEGVLLSRFPGFVTSRDALLQQAQDTQERSLITSLIIIALGITVSLLVARSIASPIKRIQGVMNEIGQGNLTVYVKPKGRDELSDLAKSINNTTEQLRNLIGKVYSASDQVVSVSGQLVASMEQNAAASSSIAENTSEVNQFTYQLNQSASQAAKATDDINNNIHDIAERCTNMQSSANATVDTVNVGNKKVADLREQMQRIQIDVSHTSASLSQLNETTKKIGEITNMIQEIASNTNLLALNASIEAARAGEHGRGFAVVANEVKKLSDESQKATEEIASLIEDIQKRTRETVESMNKSQSEIGQGLLHTDEVEQSFQSIQHELEELHRNIENVTSSVKRIQTSSEQFVDLIYEVQKNSNETNENIERIAATTEEISASADETKDLTQVLNEISSELQKEIAVFKTKEDE